MEQNFKLMFAQKAIEALEYETALDEAIKMLVPDLVVSQEQDFEQACKEIKFGLLKNARDTMKTVLKDMIEEQGEEYGRQ